MRLERERLYSTMNVEYSLHCYAQVNAYLKWKEESSFSRQRDGAHIRLAHVRQCAPNHSARRAD